MAVTRVAQDCSLGGDHVPTWSPPEMMHQDGNYVGTYFFTFPMNLWYTIEPKTSYQFMNHRILQIILEKIVIIGGHIYESSTKSPSCDA